MATCHSLRVIDGELLGDPLDIKMFEFTGWTFEEGGNAQVDHQTSMKGDTIIPSVARPPTIGYGFKTEQVRFDLANLSNLSDCFNRVVWNWAFCGHSNSFLNFAVQVSLSDSLVTTVPVYLSKVLLNV
jgi:hypothetical protein